MTPVVFTIGILNFMVGFALAVLLEREVILPLPVFGQTSPKRAGIGKFSAAEPAPLNEVRENLPRRWLELVDSTQLKVDTCADVVVEILRHDLRSYLDGMLDAEDRIRRGGENKDAGGVEEAVHALVSLNQEWIGRQRQMLQVLEENRESLGCYAALGRQLESILVDQAAVIESKCGNLARREVDGDGVAYRWIVNEGGDLIGLAHHLRDAAEDAAWRIGGREGGIRHGAMQHDEMTGLPNRVAIDLAFRQWCQEDLRRQRLLSAALIDLDHFGELNQQVGARVGNRMLKRIAGHLSELVDQETGLQRVFQHSGQRFFVFWGDSGVCEAAGRIEKVRQTMEATRLEYDGQRYTVTARAGVTGVGPDDDTASIFQRLEQLTDKARRGGRNCTEVDETVDGELMRPDSPEIKEYVLSVE